MFHKLVEHHNNLPENQERGDNNQKGFNGKLINNKEQVAMLVKTLCKEVLRNKVNRAGLLRITRTFIGKDINRSEPTVDAYLSKLKALGIIKMIEVGSHNFGGKKAIQCLYIQLNMDIFNECLAQEEATKILEGLLVWISNEMDKKTKKAESSLFKPHYKEIYTNSYRL